MRILVAGVVALATVTGFAPGSRTTPSAPVITSVGQHMYVDGMATNFVGTPGVFKLSDPGSTVTGYEYGFNTNPFIFVPASADGTAKLAITPDSLFGLTLNVQAVGSESSSPVTTFSIETKIAQGNVATLAWWKFSGKGTATADATGNGNTARLSGDAGFGCAKKAAPDGYRCSMSVTGHGGQALVEPPSVLPVVANNSLFSVSAWANLTKCAVSCTVLSEDASQVFQFALRYQRVCRAGGKSGACWKFTMPFIDQTGAKQSNAASAPGSAKLGTWTALTGVFDHTRGLLLLYINGVFAGQSSPLSPWSGSPVGPVRIGNLTPGGPAHDWNGRISDVCLFFGALQPADVTVAFHGDKAHPHDGCAALFAKYP
jgi:hypothetical protein